MKCSFTECNNTCDTFVDGTYKKHCSKSCCAKDNAAKGAEKKRQTCIARYGTPYPIGSAATRTKIKNSIKDRYGVENVSQINSVKDKKKATLIEHYGVDHPLKSQEIKDRVRTTLTEKYGVQHVSYIGKTPEAIALLTDPAKIHKLNKTFNLYSIAQQYGFSDRTLREILEKNNIDPIFHVDSSFEKEVKLYIASVYAGTITSGARILDGKDIDIFLPDRHLGFECNGAYWHSELAGKRNKDYHLTKLKSALTAGIDLKQIWDFDWYSKNDIVKSMINHSLGLSNRVYARNCEITVLTKIQERDFFNTCHIQGHVPSNIAIGLYFDDVLMAAMSFGKSRFDKSVEWELLRFSNKLYTSVAGGASKLLQYFIKLKQPASLLSYSHRHISSGSLYKQIGFEYVRSTDPSYKYTLNYKNFMSRVTFQKHKLPKMLDIFDNTLPEWENMKNNGYDRIWDCGNDVWQLKGNK